MEGWTFQARHGIQSSSYEEKLALKWSTVAGFLQVRSRSLKFQELLILKPRFWKNKDRLAPASVVSVREGKITMRKTAMIQPPDPVPPSLQLEYGPITSAGYQPQRWLMHPLVVQDPFVFTHVSSVIRERSVLFLSLICCDLQLEPRTVCL